MAGIVFIRTADLQRLRSFYVDRVGMAPWLEQPGIAILSHENLLVGFHETGSVDRDSLITVWLRTRNEVDAMHAQFRDCALTAPAVNERFRIYNFFATDPDGRKIEFQAFLHETNEVDGVPPLTPA
jgi:catechol 2,3-dioxygenase-like lactoylglutathione lyase family enzyme